MGFSPSKLDSSLFVQTSQIGPISIFLYVDDLVIAGADLGEICHVKSQVVASFDMKDLGNLHYFLVIEVIRTPEGILTSQRHYYKSISTLGQKREASPRFGTGVRPDTIPTYCRKPHLFDNHLAGPHLPGQPHQSIHVAVQGQTPSVRAKDIAICPRHEG